MKDLVIKQTGNSRTLKTALPSGTSWEDALAMLRDGTFPVDILGLVAAGVEVEGTPLNKENLLDDATATLLGLTSSDPTVKNALAALGNGLKVAGTKYGTCSTASGTAAKTSSISGFTLTTGAVVAITFSAINTDAAPTLNISSTGAKSIYDYRTNAAPAVGAMMNGTHLFVYNGAQWVLLNPASSLSLESMSWATVKAISDAGIASSLFAVGDTKSVPLSGTVGALTLNGTYYAFILGFNHNSSVEGANRIHFQFGKTAANGGADIAFCDSKYNGTGSDAAFRMNTTNTNSGGWNGSYMKKTIIPAFKNCLPSALQSVLKTVTKWTDNTGGESDTASYVTSTSETLFLLAEFEVHGARSYANSAEKNKQLQYDYYKNGNSKIKYQHGSTTSACSWWCRSPFASDTTGFCRVSSNGGADSGNAYRSYGFAPGFCV